MALRRRNGQLRHWSSPLAAIHRGAVATAPVYRNLEERAAVLTFVIGAYKVSPRGGDGAAFSRPRKPTAAAPSSVGVVGEGASGREDRGHAEQTGPAGGPAGGTAPARRLGGELRYLLRGGSPDEAKATQGFIDDTFTKRTGVKVSVEPTSGNVDEKLTAAMIGGNAQDVFDTWLDNVTPYAERGQVLDLEPLVGRDFSAEEIADFFPWQWKDFVLPGGLRFGLPKYVNVMFIYYNRDKFEQAGLQPPDESWTHDTYADAARRLTRDGTTGLFYPAYGGDRYWYKIHA